MLNIEKATSNIGSTEKVYHCMRVGRILFVWPRMWVCGGGVPTCANMFGKNCNFKDINSSILSIVQLK